MLGGIFSFGGNKIKDAIRAGAIVIDVRTVHEYDQGRLRGSINIPLDGIPVSVERILHFNKPIVFCGNGDGRSIKALRFMKKNGLKNGLEGGNWERIARSLLR